MFPLSRQLALASITGLALASLCGPAMAADGVVRSIQYDPASQHFLIDTTGPVRAIVNTLTIAGHKRLIVDVDNAEIGYELPKDAALLQQISRSMPAVRNVTVNQYGGNGRPIVRILLDIDGDLRTVRLVRNQGPRLELEVNDTSVAAQPTYSQPASGYASSGRQTVQPSVSRETEPMPSLRPTSVQPSEEMVPRSVYEQTSRTLEEQKRQMAAMQQQMSRLSAQPTTSVAPEQDPAIADLKSTVAALNKKYEALAQENQYLRARFSTSSAAATAEPSGGDAALQGEMDRLRRVNSDLQKRLDTLQTSSSRTSDTQTVELQSQLSSLRLKVESLTRENQSLKAQSASHAANAGLNQSQQSQLARLQEQVSSLTRENQALRSQLSGAQQTEVSLTARQVEVERLRRQNQELQTQVQQLSAVSSSGVTSGPTVDELKRTLVRMNQKYDTLAAENQKLKTQMATGSSASDVDLQTMRSQLTLAQQTLNQSIQTVNEQNKELAYLRNQVAQVKAGVDTSSRSEITRLENEKSERDARIRELERQLMTHGAATQSASATQMELERLKRQLSQASLQYKTSLDDVNRQLLDSTQEKQTLERQLADSRLQAERADDLQRQVNALQLQLTSRGQSAQSNMAEIQKRDAQIVALQKELTQLRSQTANGSGKDTQIASLQQQLMQLKASQGDATRLHTEIVALKAELEKSRQKPSATVSNAELTEAKNELARMTKENLALQEVIDNLKSFQQSGGQADSTEVRQLRDKLASLQSRYDQAVQEANKTRQDLEAARKATASTAKPTTTAPAAGNTTVLQKQVADLTRDLSDAKRENASLKSRISAIPAATTVQPTRQPSSNAEAEKSYAEAKTAMGANDLKTALDKYKQALLLDQDNSRFAVDYGIALAEEHQYAEGIDVMRRYLQRNPGDREAYNQLGKLYLLNDQTDAATQAFSRAIPVSTLNNYATSLKKLGKLDDAEAIFKMALKLNPNDSEVLFNLGNLYNAANKLELARNNYLQALQLRPDFAEAHYNLGLVYSKIGNKPEAVKHLERFLQLSPSARNAETIRAYVQKLKA